jgi:hypothetical protein
MKTPLYQPDVATICSKFSKCKASSDFCKPGVREGAHDVARKWTEQPTVGEDTAFLLEFERSPAQAEVQ